MEEIVIADKWVDEGRGIFYPISGGTILHQSLGRGVFEVYQSQGQDRRIGLKKLSKEFTFNYKIYDLGCDSLMNTIIKTWESDQFIEENRNLGVIFYGTKGTGKSIAAKILSNMTKLPVIIVPRMMDGLVDFIQSLYFEAVILIDEAEKLFKKNESGEVLLKIVDGTSNRSRKLYILTVNKLDINENLLGRPGRIRYIRKFGNLSEKAVNEYIDDNLRYPDKRKDILELVDLLEISTIDILKNIVEEVNIHGSIVEDSYLNIPKANYVFDIIRFRDCNEERTKEIKECFRDIRDVSSWLKEKSKDKDMTNEDWIYERYSGYVTKITSPFPNLWKGCNISGDGEILETPGKDGFFIYKCFDYDKEEFLCKIIGQRNNPSLYRGGLI